MNRWRAARMVGSAVLAVAAASPPASGQSCQVNNQGSCIVEGGTITIRLTRAARVAAPASSVALPQADIAAFQSGFGAAEPIALTVQSNSPWSLGVHGGAAVWLAAPATARQDKPVSDLQWATTPGGPFTDLSAALATAATGAPTGTGVVTLYLRSRYTWSLDRPGAYTLPLVVTLTAP